MPTQPERGQLYWLDWNPARGSEQAGTRPALVVQTNVPNQIERYPLTIVIAVTSVLKGYRSSVEVQPSSENGLTATSEILCNQLQTVDKSRLNALIGKLSDADMHEVDTRLSYMLGLR